MDQKFKLVAPRARLTEDYGNPIEDILFGSGWDRGIGIKSSYTAERLVDLLAIPVVHKDDRKPASAEPQNTPPNSSSHNQDLGHDLLVVRAIKREASVKILKSHPLKEANQGDQTECFRSATLSRLPTELLLGIMSYIEDIEDVVSLGLVNKRLCRKLKSVRDPAMNSLIKSCDIYRDYFPRDQPWILRNLTTKQFVRAEAIALKLEFIKGPHIIGLGFGEVLLSRISWTSAALNMEDPANIRRGIWAGHCFDITTLTRHERKTNGDAEWTDVSDEVVTEIATIWESYFGADWRETLCRVFETRNVDSRRGE
ncbi:hypothetical protein ACHAO4_009736 [Trichoderma viride]